MLKVWPILIIFLSINASASYKVVYGEDNRVDTYASTSALYQQIAASTAAMISKTNVKIRGNTGEIDGVSLRDVYRLCPKERFQNQPTSSECSGFLVAPDIIATAGHCINSRSDCSSNYWIFDYKVADKNQPSVSVGTNNIYKCTGIIKKEVTIATGKDFALIRLDRKVTDVAPVKISSTPIKVGTPLVLIGHPSGLPQKITDNAKVMKVEANFFRADLDAFQGNSGSAVFNSTNGELVGILVEGDPDYYSTPAGCVEVKKAPLNSKGEQVSLPNQFLPFMPKP